MSHAPPPWDPPAEPPPGDHHGFLEMTMVGPNGQRHPRPLQRIIGIEVRHIDAFGMSEEVALVPCDIRLPVSMNAGIRGCLSLTIHTSHGDINLAERPQLRA
jgi:hypothetical protein